MTGLRLKFIGFSMCFFSLRLEAANPFLQPGIRSNPGDWMLYLLSTEGSYLEHFEDLSKLKIEKEATSVGYETYFGEKGVTWGGGVQKEVISNKRFRTLLNEGSVVQARSTTTRNINLAFGYLGFKLPSGFSYASLIHFGWGRGDFKNSLRTSSSKAEFVRIDHRFTLDLHPLEFSIIGHQGVRIEEPYVRVYSSDKLMGEAAWTGLFSRLTFSYAHISNGLDRTHSQDGSEYGLKFEGRQAQIGFGGFYKMKQAHYRHLNEASLENIARSTWGGYISFEDVKNSFISVGISQILYDFSHLNRFIEYRPLTVKFAISFKGN